MNDLATNCKHAEQNIWSPREHNAMVPRASIRDAQYAAFPDGFDGQCFNWEAKLLGGKTVVTRKLK